MAFETKFEARDTYVDKIRRNHGVPEQASQEEIQPIAIQLFTEGNYDDATTLVMNRRVDASEIDFGFVALSNDFMSPKQKHGALLMMKAAEEMAAE